MSPLDRLSTAGHDSFVALYPGTEFANSGEAEETAGMDDVRRRHGQRQGRRRGARSAPIGSRYLHQQSESFPALLFVENAVRQHRSKAIIEHAGWPCAEAHHVGIEPRVDALGLVLLDDAVEQHPFFAGPIDSSIFRFTMRSPYSYRRA